MQVTVLGCQIFNSTSEETELLERWKNAYQEDFGYMSTLCILDDFESLVWVDRYNKCGTFELYSPVTEDILEYCVPGNLLSFSESTHTMIIEDRSIESNSETGDRIKIIGRSLESILDRRIIKDKIKTNNRQTIVKVIEKLLQKNIIFSRTYLGRSRTNMEDKRRLPFFNIDPDLLDAENDTFENCFVDANEYDKDNLLTVIEDLCETYKVGYEVIMHDSKKENDTDNSIRRQLYADEIGNDHPYLYFNLYKGVNRSFLQDEELEQTEVSAWWNSTGGESSFAYNANQFNTPIIFSSNYDNLLESNFVETTSSYKNMILVTDGNEEEPTVVYAGDTNSKALTRRETAIQASVQKEEMSDADYKKLLKQNGLEELEKLKIKKEFDGKCETLPGSQFVYGQDYFMGDIVEIRNEYGIAEAAMITEFTWSINSEGLTCYPTFTVLNETLVEEEEDN